MFHREKPVRVVFCISQKIITSYSRILHKNKGMSKINQLECRTHLPILYSADKQYTRSNKCHRDFTAYGGFNIGNRELGVELT